MSVSMSDYGRISDPAESVLLTLEIPDTDELGLRIISDMFYVIIMTVIGCHIS